MTQDSQSFTPERPLRVAVVGSGPSGIYSAESLIKQAEVPVEVDIFDRLPTPYGLVRYGVAPDHLTIKSVTKAFEKTLNDDRVRFLGNVEFGRDLSREQLLEHYDAVIYAVGASSDRRLGIPGEDLTGSLSATEFVAWYNGHPDAATRDLDLSGVTGVAVIGVGNVALDVSRILAKTADELHTSDIAGHALDVLRGSGVKDVYVMGRRGPVQAKFTTKELREFGELEAANVALRPEEMQVSEAEEAAITDNVVKKNLEVLRGFGELERRDVPRTVHFRFLVSPTEILGDEQGRVRAIRIEKNRLTESGGAEGTGEYEEIPVQLVLRSVGYRGVPLPGVPFDEKAGTIANEGGRVTGGQGEYTAGWIKRGPSGVIGTNRKCAADTVALLLEDVNSGTLAPRAGSREALDTHLAAHPVYTFEDWQVLDQHEQSSGSAAGRPRAKVVRLEEMLGHRRG
ncbi:Ferredoxin--NADP(+) reductase [Deinococcus proteolyticus MRP]|uniref:Ferredoxin--NADP(+) reductase n=1 Tax=Deinococcus proteolyticus (strain ATCC 35074 / DSM 20540 / JCM 6276 / NBRC 101906 / NCIMB 13154 / VKM Ac-1939 / CCM 2703 / MRP) TaxID=693977 RepID=F0RM89_DEIPM|nr:FAD-dependent oxidoreductase [Deinococcus proteolyticus]ADY26009.1 Ferredoxin--NADP(+) reductase [Deinococcus proteolyticus MRP]